MSAAARSRLHAMAEALSRYGNVRNENLIRHGLNYCHQYLDFLIQGLIDFEAANSNYLESTDRLNASFASIPSGTSVQLSPEQQQLFEESSRAMRIVQYRIEAFYLFAKILLDRIADTLLTAYDLDRPKFGSSHSAMLKLLSGGWARDWSLAGALGAQAEELKSIVVDFKTEVLEHLQEFRRVRAISIGPDRHVRIAASGMLYPDPADTFEDVSTENLYDLRSRLDRYIDTFAGFIEANVDRSILMQAPRTEPGKGGH